MNPQTLFKMKKLMAGAILMAITGWIYLNTCSAGNGHLIFVCTEHNDLYRAVGNAGVKYPRVMSAMDAAEMALPGSGILILADRYPKQKVVLEKEFFPLAKDKKLRVYIEFPDSLPGWKTGAVQSAEWERGVVTSDAFGASLPGMRILMLHQCHFVQAEVQNPCLVLSKVAGFDSAVYSLDGTTAYPLLFELPDAQILVSTTKLSHFITGRYAPKDAWEAVWAFIFKWLQPDGAVQRLSWTETVHPAFEKNEKLSKGSHLQAARRGVDWYYHAMALAVKSFITDDQLDRSTAVNLQDFVYFYSPLQQGPRARTDNPSFGFIDWYTHDNEEEGIYYSDDNSPFIRKLGTIDGDLVETTPIVFNEKVYRYEYVRKGYAANLAGDSYSRFIDHESGTSTRALDEGYHLGSAFVEGDTVYVTAPHALRYLNGWICNFYLEAFEGYEIRVVRSRDLINWEASPHNPVLKASEEDKKIANPGLTPVQRVSITAAKDINNSDIDFCKYKGKLIIN